jgi:hypothetical protein
MAIDLIRYDLLVQDALRGVVKAVLDNVARDGLPGGHHCFITFRTNAPGVRLSNALRQRFPQEMTVALQHQFERLEVSDKAFEVGLSFNGRPERIMVPFACIIQYDDPEVGFRLRFDYQDDQDGIPTPDEANAGETKPGADLAANVAALPAPSPALQAARQPRGKDPRAQDLKTQDLKNQDLKNQDLKNQDLKNQDLKTQDLKIHDPRGQEQKTQEQLQRRFADQGPAQEKAAGRPLPQEPRPAGETKVISIDSFRKKP